MNYTKTTRKPRKTSIFSVSRYSSQGVKPAKPAFTKCKRHSLKIAAALMLGMIGGACWLWNIQTAAHALAAAIEKEQMPLVFDNSGAMEKLKQAEAERVAKEEAERLAMEPKDCNEAAEKYGPQYGASVKVLKAIIKYESGNNARAENRLSSATGCFQWITKTWQGYGKELWKDARFEKSPYSHVDNTELAAYVIGKYGLEKARHEWAESRHNWEKEAF